MYTKDIFWDFFEATGNIGAYLIFREISRNNRLIFKEYPELIRKKRLG